MLTKERGRDGWVLGAQVEILLKKKGFHYTKFLVKFNGLYLLF